MSRIHQIVAERIIRPLKRPVWYAVHSLTGLRIQMATHTHDAFMFSSSLRMESSSFRHKYMLLTIQQAQLIHCVT